MPILIKPRQVVCKERAAADADYYYSPFAQLLIETNNEEKDMETHQELMRLSRWVEKYKEFAFKYHMENFIQGPDIYVNEEDGIKFGGDGKIEKAPFIEVFEDIDNGDD
jgi:hypothetical protein